MVYKYKLTVGVADTLVSEIVTCEDMGFSRQEWSVLSEYQQAIKVEQFFLGWKFRHLTEDYEPIKD